MQAGAYVFPHFGVFAASGVSLTNAFFSGGTGFKKMLSSKRAGLTVAHFGSELNCTN